jgi:hypothetical protein
MLSVVSDFKKYSAEADKLLGLTSNLGRLEPEYQKLAAETILLRQSYMLENTLKSISCKLVCGAKYLDNSSPNPEITLRSINDALVAMKSHGREKARNDLRWSKVNDIKQNLENLVPSDEYLIVQLERHGALISDIRKVRNQIAHNNSATRKEYRYIVKKHYGAYLNNITPGILLLSDRRSPNLLFQYLKQSQVLMKQILKDPPPTG